MYGFNIWKQWLKKLTNVFLSIYILLFLILPIKVNASASWYNRNWQYRKQIVVDNSQNTQALTNYQVNITLSSANFDFSKSQSSGQDIRITNSDGTSLLSYWIETYDNSNKSASIWVNIPSISASSQTAIYIYYGNPTASSVASGDNTFLFFDDFERPAWRILTPIPLRKADLTAGVVNNKIYLIGGYNDNATDPRSETYEYDPTTDSYTQKASMPTARWGEIGTTFNNKIYVFGGDDVAGGVTTNEMYDPVTDQWTTKESLPASLGHAGISGCTTSNKIYLFFKNAAYEYDPATGIYTIKANPPTTIYSWPTCAYYDNKIYLIGGWVASNVGTTKVQIYDIASNTWSSGTDAPFGFFGSIRENPIIGDNVYIVGGQRNYGEFSSKAYVYNITSNSWTEKSFGPYALDGNAGGIVNNKVYSFGGRNDDDPDNRPYPWGLDYAIEYDPSLDTTAKWIQIKGNFTMNNGILRRNVPPRGSLWSQHPSPQMRTNTYQTSGNFILETKATLENSTGWNSLTIHGNTGIYASTLNGYLLPYNNFGASPAQSFLSKETSATITNLNNTETIGTGTFRYKIVSTTSNINVYKDNQLYLTTADSTYRDGYIHFAQTITNTTSWPWIFVRQYTDSEPSTTLGGEENVPISSTSTSNPPICGDTPPGNKAPWLYKAIAQESNSILLSFTDADDPIDKYVLEYGLESNNYIYGAQNIGGKGTRTYLVQSLQPNTTYYFKIRAGNGCTTGPWSNEISTKTLSMSVSNQTNLVSLKSKEPSIKVKTVCQTYTVKSGDNLWSIANNLLGNGSKYKEIIEQNKDKYPSLDNSNTISIGRDLKINCNQQSNSAEAETDKGYDVKVKVKDTNNKPVEGAIVTLHSATQSAKTDKNGIATFKNVEQGDHKVLIAYNNYQGEQSINLAGDVKEFDLNVTVQQKAKLLSPLAYEIIGVLVFVILVLIALLVKSRK